MNNLASWPMPDDPGVIDAIEQELLAREKLPKDAGELRGMISREYADARRNINDVETAMRQTVLRIEALLGDDHLHMMRSNGEARARAPRKERRPGRGRLEETEMGLTGDKALYEADRKDDTGLDDAR